MDDLIENAAPVGDAAVLRLETWRGDHAPMIGLPCANCGIPVEGPFCLACGQAAESLHRSVGALLMEAFESLLHTDGRLITTLRRLLLAPAALTRDYLNGRRAAQSPPFRLFLVVMVVVFFTNGLSNYAHPGPPLFKRDSPTEAVTLSPGSSLISRTFAGWVNPRLTYAISHQTEFGEVLESELHSTAIVFLPIAALLLGAIFAFRRRYYLYDHAIFAMHSLAFMGLLFSALSVVSIFIRAGLLVFLSIVAASSHLFIHLRGVYGTGAIGTLLRMAALLVGSALAVVVLVVLDVALGLQHFSTPPT